MSLHKTKKSIEEPRGTRNVTVGEQPEPYAMEEEEQEIELEEESSGSGMSYICPQCQATFGDPLHLDNHINKHSQGLICSLCGYEGNSRETVNGHERLHRNRSSVQCLLCKERLVEEKQLIKHLGRHILGLNSCPWCPFISGGVSALKKHIDHHLAKFRVDCPFCNYFAFSEEDLRAHSEIHSGESRLAKVIYRRKPTGVPVVTTEMLCEEEPVADEAEQKAKCKVHLDNLLERALFRCCLCGKRLKTDKLLREHMEKHMQPGVSYCPYCTYQSTDREQIFQHVLNHLQPQQQEEKPQSSENS